MRYRSARPEDCLDMTAAHARPISSRPRLSPTLSEEDFLAWYWLKAELIAFCRELGMPSGGDKATLSARVAARLGDRAPATVQPARQAAARNSAPQCLTLETVVVSGYRLSEQLRAFFVQHEGPRFRFNQALRDFFRDPAGRTLADAIALYRNAALAPGQPIGRQFEYNRHMRAYFEAHPDASMQQARQAWWDRRSSRKRD